MGEVKPFTGHTERLRSKDHAVDFNLDKTGIVSLKAKVKEMSRQCILDSKRYADENSIPKHLFVSKESGALGYQASLSRRPEEPEAMDPAKALFTAEALRMVFFNLNDQDTLTPFMLEQCVSGAVAAATATFKRYEKNQPSFVSQEDVRAIGENLLLELMQCAHKISPSHVQVR